MNPLCQLMILLRASAGNFPVYSDNFTRFFEAIEGAVGRFVSHKITGRPVEDLEEIVQNAFIRFNQIIQGSESPLPTHSERELYAWLFVITKRVAIDFVRPHSDPAKRFTDIAVTFEEEQLPALEDPSLKAIIDAELLHSVLAELSEFDRQCLYHCVILGKTQEEAGLDLGYASATIGRHKQQALFQCRELLRQKFGIQDNDELWGFLTE